MTSRRTVGLFFSLVLIAASVLLGQSNSNQLNTSSISFSRSVTNTSGPLTLSIGVTPVPGTTAPNSWSVATSASSGGSWLSAPSNTFNGNGSFTISVTTTGLAVGVYSGTVTVSFAQGSPSKIDVPITLTIVPSLTFTGTPGSPIPSQSFSLGSANSFTAVASTFSGGNWLSVTPTSGSGSVTLTASVNTTGLAAGFYSGQIAVNSSTSATVPVTLNLSGPGVTATPSVLTFSTLQGLNPAIQQVSLGSTAASLMWTSSVSYSTGSNWLSVAPSAGLFGTSASIVVKSDALAPGSYSASVIFSSSGSPATLGVPVTLTVTQPPAGVLQVSPGAIAVQAVAGASAPTLAYFQVGNTGGTVLPFTAQTSTVNGGNWLSVSPSSGQTSLGAFPTVAVSINSQGLQAGVYQGSIALGSITIPVQVTVVAAGPVLTVGSKGLFFTTAQGNTATQAKTVFITNTGSGSVAWTADVLSGSNIFKVTPSSGTSASGAGSLSALQVTANASNLAPGTYYGLVRVDTQLIDVVLNVQPSTAKGMQYYPLGMIFVAQQGATSPPPAQLIALTNNATSPVTINATTQVSTGAQWLSFTPAPLTVGSSATGNVAVNAATLQPGVYLGTITLVPADGSSPGQDITVFLVVTPSAGVQSEARGPAIACTTTKIVMSVRQLGANFSSTVGWPVNLEAQLVDDCGNPLTGSTVLATFSTGDPALALAHLGNGIYSATWKPATPNPALVTFRAVQAPFPAVSQIIGGQVGANPAPPPAVGTGGVVNAASFTNSGGLAPGAIVSVFGTNLASGTNSSSFPLPTTLGNIKLTIGGKDMPLFFSNSGQVNAQVPFDLPTAAASQVVARSITGSVEADAVPEPVTIGAVQPGIFLTSAPATQGVILNNPGLQVVDGSHPATAGDVLTIYCTGLGLTNPVVATGAPSPGSPAAQVTNVVTATIGGVNAPVQFAGLTPQLVGLYQVNVVVPSGVSSGAQVPVILTQNGIASPLVTVAVK